MVSRISNVVAFALIAVATALPSIEADAAAALKEQKKGGGTVGRQVTVNGCLQKGASGETYTVQNIDAKGPKIIGIVDSKAKLPGHVGHRIEITGTPVEAKEAEAMKPAPPKADQYIRIETVKMVSATCP